jgi:hypothetical protein
MSAAPGPVRVRAAGAERLWVVEEPVDKLNESRSYRNDQLQ